MNTKPKVKQIFSFLLAMCVMVTLAPAAAFASEASVDYAESGEAVKKISSINVSVAEPVVGAHPSAPVIKTDNIVFCDGEGEYYEGVGYSWYELSDDDFWEKELSKDDVFEAGKRYELNIEFLPASEDYEFDCDNFTFLLNGVKNENMWSEVYANWGDVYFPFVHVHAYSAAVVKPTYTAQGYTLHKCSECGASYKDSYTDKLTLPGVSGLAVGGRAGDALRLNWNKNAAADGYIIEQYTGGKWVRIARIAGNATTTYRVTGLEGGTDYKFRMKAFKLEGSTAAYSAYTAAFTAGTNPSLVSGFKLGGRAADALRLNWNKNTSADGYIIEQYTDGKWVRVAKITNNAATTYRVTGLKASTTYKFRMRSYKMSGTTPLYSGYTGTMSVTTNPYAVSGLKIGGQAKTALRLNWSKNTSADGYIAEMYSGGKWVRIAKITNNATLTYRKADLKANTTYKFRVRAYHMVGEVALYGNYANVSGTTLK